MRKAGKKEKRENTSRDERNLFLVCECLSGDQGEREKRYFWSGRNVVLICLVLTPDPDALVLHTLLDQMQNDLPRFSSLTFFSPAFRGQRSHNEIEYQESDLDEACFLS